jgi:hypothetical protein
MNRTRALILALAIGVAAVAGVFALGHTISLGSQARATTDAQVAQRAARLDRYEASLRKALAQRPPKLPPLPAASAASAAPIPSAAPVRIVYKRPPPIVVTKHRTGVESEGEHGYENENGGVESDD